MGFNSGFKGLISLNFNAMGVVKFQFNKMYIRMNLTTIIRKQLIHFEYKE